MGTNRSCEAENCPYDALGVGSRYCFSHADWHARQLAWSLALLGGALLAGLLGVLLASGGFVRVAAVPPLLWASLLTAAVAHLDGVYKKLPSTEG